MSRIIAGSRGGRRISMPPGDRTRPTTDRVREALFSAIAAWAGTAAEPAEQSLVDLAFCDLYAGSGAVGSGGREPWCQPGAAGGAGPAYGATRQGQCQSPRVGDRRCHLIGRTAAPTAAGSGLRCRLRRPAVRAGNGCASAPNSSELVANRWVGPDSLIVVERSRRTPELVWPEVAAKRWTRAYGETTLYFAVARS